MNIAIVEDALEDRKKLIDSIKKYAKENAVLLSLEEYESGEAFLNWASPGIFDAVFLDIYMEKLTGMDVAHAIRKVSQSCEIVFVTTTADFAVQSYTVRAFHYILKPYTYEDIVNVMNLLDKSFKKSSRYIKIKEGREWRKVLLSDILYVDYSNHYVQIHTPKEIISTYMKFSEIEKMLSVNSEFLSCYRGIMVNMKKIKKVDDLFFLIENGEYIPINRKRIKDIKNRYADYIFEALEEQNADMRESIS